MPFIILSVLALLYSPLVGRVILFMVYQVIVALLKYDTCQLSKIKLRILVKMVLNVYG
jgi:hypothetical protein